MQSKISPPRLDDRYLFRNRLMESVASRQGASTKLILVEAQAGQGKSTFAAQYLSHIGADYSWYQLGPEDRDPVALIGALLSALMEALPAFCTSLLHGMIKNGEVTANEPFRFAKILRDDLRPILRGDFYLVLDDVHLIEDSADSLAFLKALIETAPRGLRFILLSRGPAPCDMASEGRLVVGNDELALTPREIAELFGSKLGLSIPTDTVLALDRLTEGWAMGLALAGQVLSREGGTYHLAEVLPTLQRGGILDYFLAEILARLPGEQRCAILKLSLLENIPVPLAETLTEVGEIQVLLTRWLEQNLFLRRLDEAGSLFIFHRLFRDSLRAVAESEIPREECRQVLREAGAWHLEQNRPEEALVYYLGAYDYEGAETVLGLKGMDLVAANHLATLQAALTGIPESALSDYPWLCYYRGLTHLDTDPPEAYRWLVKAKGKFIQVNNSLGELLTLSDLIYFHITIDACFHKALLLLEKAEPLYSEWFERLPAWFRLQIARNLASACCYVKADIARSDHYSALSLTLARDNDMVNFVAGGQIVRGFQHLLTGMFKDCRRLVEETAPLLLSPYVSANNKLFLKFFQVNLLAMEGDVEGYRRHRNLLKELVEENLVARSVVGPYLLRWDVDLAIARGEYGEAEEVLRRGLAQGHAGATPHLRSQYLQYLALVTGLWGKVEEAETAAFEALELRREAGGEIFKPINEMIVGASFALVGNAPEAIRHLTDAVTGAEKLGAGYINAGACAHRALVWLGEEEDVKAMEDIRSVLTLLREDDCVHFFSWTPDVMRRVLSLAVRHGIEGDYARKLAEERLGLALLPGGEEIPLLEIRTLGGLQLEMDGAGSIAVSDLTPAQRELLALLIASPSRCSSQEQIQVALWPDSPPKKARSAFDNLVSRVRRVMDEAFAPHAARNYLVLEKGILCLRNCRIDVVEFSKKATAGHRHLRRKEFWQAGNAFYSAHRLWRGEFMPGVNSGEKVWTFREDLSRLYLKSVSAWSEILAAEGQAEEAIGILSKALKVDGTHEPLVRLLYDLHSRKGEAVKARKTIEGYRNALKCHDFTEEEIEDILEAFWNTPT